MGKASRTKRESAKSNGISEAGNAKTSGDLKKTGFLLKTYVHIFLIIALGFIAYSNTFHSPFQWDEVAQILENPVIRDLDNYISGTKGYTYVSNHYNPRRSVGYLTFALNYHFGGFRVTGYHVVNLLIHIANAILAYFLVILTFRTPYFSGQQSANSDQRSRSSDSPFTIHHSRLIALLTALLFISHPIQTQAVTYVVQRFASLAAMFYLLSLLMYIQGRLASGQAGRLAGYSLSLLFAVFAMNTKEITFTLPVMLALYEGIFFRSSLKKRFLTLLPVVLVLVIVLISVSHSGKSLGEMLSDATESTRVQTAMSRGDYLLTQMRVITTYIRLIFLPVNQNFDYDYPVERTFFTLPVFFSFLFLAALLGTAVYLLYRSGQEATGSSEQTGAEGGRSRNDSRSAIHYFRFIGFGILWFFIALSVESSIIPIRDVIFEHRVYLPSVGLFAAITTGVLVAAQRLKMEKVAMSVLMLAILIFSGATYARNTVWASKISLWEDVTQKSPNKARGHNNLGIFYSEQGFLDKGSREFQAAIEINPGYSDAHYNLGKYYLASGRMNEALTEFQTAVRLKPDYAEAHNNLGAVYETLGRVDDAIREYQTSLQINPDHLPARENLGRHIRVTGDKR